MKMIVAVVAVVVLLTTVAAMAGEGYYNPAPVVTEIGGVPYVPAEVIVPTVPLMPAYSPETVWYQAVNPAFKATYDQWYDRRICPPRPAPPPTAYQGHYYYPGRAIMVPAPVMVVPCPRPRPRPVIIFGLGCW